jgi:multiple sugar transport system permease protein
MATPAKYVNTSPWYGLKLRGFAAKSIVTFFATLIVVIYLLPFFNMSLIAIKTQQQQKDDRVGGTVLPVTAATFNYEGTDYPVYSVPIDGTTRELALVDKKRNESQFIDPANPGAGLIVWEGKWQQLEQVSHFDPYFGNFGEAWDKIKFPRLFFNTLMIAIIGLTGTLLSSISVAYAFARFPLPGKNIMFLILIGTIILPGQVTLIPTYAFFAGIGWTNSWLPLTVPHFFANAYNVFLLRQYFMTLPKELDEAAMIDGAGPLRILLSVIIPLSWPVIISVALFHFVFAWNDYFGPLLYLLGKPELQPISVGVQVFNFQYGPRPELVQATSLMAMVLPLVLFFLGQRFFMRGVVLTGVDK